MCGRCEAAYRTRKKVSYDFVVDLPFQSWNVTVASLVYLLRPDFGMRKLADQYPCRSVLV